MAPEGRPRMESAKPSVRFKPTIMADPDLSNSSPDDVAARETLRALDSEWFTTDGYVEPKYQSLTEKGIRLLCSELVELKKASAEEMRRNVYANYTAFIRTSQELGELETELMALRTLISTQADLVHDLLDGELFQPLSNFRANTHQEISKPEDNQEPLDVEKRFHVLSDAFDMCLVEHKVDEALVALDEVERMISDSQGDNLEPTAVVFFTSALSEQKARFIAQLVEAAWQPTIHGKELRKLVSILNQLGDGCHAHTLLLNYYHNRLQNGVKSLRSTCSWYTGAYTTALAQLFFSVISQASSDSSVIFGNGPACASKLVMWACKETEEYVLLLKKNISSSSLMADRIGAAVDSVQISLGHCALLENQGLSLCPLLLRQLKPFFKGVLQRCLMRMEESLKAYVASDNWTLIELPVWYAVHQGQSSRAPTELLSNVKLCTSAHKLNSMVQDLLEDLTPTIVMQFGKIVLEGISDIFDLYIKILITALSDVNDHETLKHGVDDTHVIFAETEAQQLAILGSAAALADELLPQAAFNWQKNVSKEEWHRQRQEQPPITGTRLLEQKDWRRHLQRAVDELRDRCCKRHVLQLLFDKTEKPLLTAELYLAFHDSEKKEFWQQEPMPSAPFQALFMKLKGIQELSADILCGRERVAILLLMRLTEVFVIWLSEDDYFWGSIEDGPKTIGPSGLQQFVVDMEFVIQIATAGGYSSRKVQQSVSAMISRAENALAASGMDPKSILPENQWFEDTAKHAMHKILASVPDQSFKNQESGSPTAVSGVCIGDIEA